MYVQKPMNYQIKEQNAPYCVPAEVLSNNPITSFKEWQPIKHRQVINYSFPKFKFYSAPIKII